MAKLKAGRRARRRMGMRLWLGAAFGGVSLVTAASVYLFVSDSSGSTLSDQAADLAVGRTSSLANELSRTERRKADAVLADFTSEFNMPFAVNARGRSLSPADAAAEIRRLEGG